MKEIKFQYKDSALIRDKEIKSYEKKLSPEISNMNNALKKGYSDDRASINLCDDKEMIQTVLNLAKEKIKSLGITIFTDKKTGSVTFF